MSGFKMRIPMNMSLHSPHIPPVTEKVLPCDTVERLNPRILAAMRPFIMDITGRQTMLHLTITKLSCREIDHPISSATAGSPSATCRPSPTTQVPALAR